MLRMLKWDWTGEEQWCSAYRNLAPAEARNALISTV